MSKDKKLEVNIGTSFRIEDFDEFREVLDNVEDGCINIVENSKDDEAVFWAGRILKRLEGFSRGSDS